MIPPSKGLLAALERFVNNIEYSDFSESCSLGHLHLFQSSLSHFESITRSYSQPLVISHMWLFKQPLNLVHDCAIPGIISFTL